MADSASAGGGGIGIFGLIFVVLLVLKVAGLQGASWGLANLSWFWVFSPLIAAFGLWLIFVLIAIAIVAFK